jgi:type I restriction enzyme S subunit
MQMSKTEIPSIRFRGFDDAWEQRKLGEVIRLNGRIGFRGYTEKDIVTKDDGGVLTFSPTNIVDNKLTTNCKNTYITRFKYDESPEIKIHNGDILFVKTGSTLGKSALVTGLSEDATLNPQVVVMRTNNLNVEFLAAMLVTNAIISQVNSAKIGGAIPTLTETRIKDFDVAIPVSEAEKEQIGQFFSQLDHLITLHQRKFEKLTNVKKSMLEKMFPQNGSCYPAVRFKGFTGPWERRKFGDVFEEYSEKNRADLPPLTIIQGSGTIRRDESERALQYDKASLSNYKVVNEGDLIVHLRSFEGGLEKANSQGIISPAYHTFHGEGVDSRFYYTYFRSKNFIDTDLKPHVYGIRDGRSIDVEGMKTIEIPFTSYPEQKLIGDAIDSINTLISLQRRELEKLQSIKKSLLEKMFV